MFDAESRMFASAYTQGQCTTLVMAVTEIITQFELKCDSFSYCSAEISASTPAVNVTSPFERLL